MKIVVVEKEYVKEQIEKSLSKEQCSEIHFVVLKGRAYIEEDKKYLRLTDEELATFPIIFTSPEKVLLLGADHVDSEIKDTLVWLKSIDISSIECIVNACDSDKDWDYIFKYFYEKLDVIITQKRIDLQDFKAESIQKEFNKI